MPLKSISVVPTRLGGNRKRPSPVIVEGLEESPAHPVVRTVPVIIHRYLVGERLRMNGSSYPAPRSASGCTVIARLPYEGSGALLYRVRSDSEPFERVVIEADLAQ